MISCKARKIFWMASPQRHFLPSPLCQNAHLYATILRHSKETLIRATHTVAGSRGPEREGSETRAGRSACRGRSRSRSSRRPGSDYSKARPERAAGDSDRPRAHHKGHSGAGTASAYPSIGTQLQQGAMLSLICGVLSPLLTCYCAHIDVHIDC